MAGWLDGWMDGGFEKEFDKLTTNLITYFLTYFGYLLSLTLIAYSARVFSFIIRGTTKHTHTHAHAHAPPSFPLFSPLPAS